MSLSLLQLVHHLNSVSSHSRQLLSKEPSAHYLHSTRQQTDMETSWCTRHFSI